ncbi:MAG TPA: helix-turn-helix domain-containing protein [Ilumatobacteraceae bacterium]|nr:helix-turn-helix domain-containing protein [Ilumatobacteraceae bacterium]
MATVVKRGVAKPTGRDEILDAVLDAAERLMAAGGPDVSLRAIADEAGVNYSLVHRHLGTKDELVERLLIRYAERWMKTLDDDPDFGRALDRLLPNGCRCWRISAPAWVDDAQRGRHRRRRPPPPRPSASLGTVA